MKLVRYGTFGEEKPGLIDKTGQLRDISAAIGDLRAKNLNRSNLTALSKCDETSFPIVTERPRIGSCVAIPSNFIGVGLNYRDHAEEAGFPVPTEPILFNKAPNSLCGPNDDIVRPRNSRKLDWEVELAVVIGDGRMYIARENAMSHIAGFCLANDVSDRAFQAERGGNWMKGKSAPTFGPLGPFLVTPDEIPDVQDLDMHLEVNGEPMQAGNTRTMIFGVAHIISYVSEFMCLEPGDVILTGTPPGVGAAKKPQRFLEKGDVVTATITGLGMQANRIVVED